MGKSWSLTTIQAASNWRMSSSCPTHCTVSSSGWARRSVTPSISTVMYLSLPGSAGGFRGGRWREMRRAVASSNIADYDLMDLEQEIHLLEGDTEGGSDLTRRLATSVHAQGLRSFAEVQSRFRRSRHNGGGLLAELPK